MKIQKKWGNIKQYALNRNCSVKVINLKPLAETSLHFHNLRIDTWVVLNGILNVQIGDQVHEALPGDEFYIPAGQKHKLIAGDDSCRVLEIAYGYSTEDDTQRIKDTNGPSLTRTSTTTARKISPK